MGTRGMVGFVLDGQVKGSYNHFDSYPSGVGHEVVAFVQGVATNDRWNDLKEKVKALVMVTDDSQPSPKLIERYSKFHDGGVSTGEKIEWYSLLRYLQGVAGMNAVLEGETGHLVDGADFANDGLFCEWAYLVNLDDQTVEVYKGFAKKGKAGNRFGGKKKGEDYAPVQIVRTIPLADFERGVEIMDEIENEDRDE